MSYTSPTIVEDGEYSEGWSKKIKCQTCGAELQYGESELKKISGLKKTFAGFGHGLNDRVYIMCPKCSTKIYVDTQIPHYIGKRAKPEGGCNIM